MSRYRLSPRFKEQLAESAKTSVYAAITLLCFITILAGVIFFWAWVFDATPRSMSVGQVVVTLSSIVFMAFVGIAVLNAYISAGSIFVRRGK